MSDVERLIREARERAERIRAGRLDKALQPASLRSYMADRPAREVGDLAADVFRLCDALEAERRENEQLREQLRQFELYRNVNDARQEGRDYAWEQLDDLGKHGEPEGDPDDIAHDIYAGRHERVDDGANPVTDLETLPHDPPEGSIYVNASTGERYEWRGGEWLQEGSEAIEDQP